MPEPRLTTSESIDEDQKLDLTLQPQNLDEFIGQEKIKDGLKIFLTYLLLEEKSASDPKE